MAAASRLLVVARKVLIGFLTSRYGLTAPLVSYR
jgi:hypothetical protein